MMPRTWLLSISMSIVLAIVVLHVSALADDNVYIEVTGSRVAIRSAPSHESALVGYARKGDIFIRRRTQAEWYKISLFSWAPRYLERSYARPTSELPVALPPTDAMQQALFHALTAAEQCAHLHAERQYPLWDRVSAFIPEHLAQHSDTTDLLQDRYALRVLRAFGSGWPEYDKIMLKGLLAGWETEASKLQCTPTGVRLPSPPRRVGGRLSDREERNSDTGGKR